MIMNVYSFAGATPICGPVPIRSGRRYIEPPVPYGGMYSLFFFTTFSHASRNISSGTGAMQVRTAVRYMRFAFSSGRKMTILPLFWRKHLMPSKHSWP